MKTHLLKNTWPEHRLTYTDELEKIFAQEKFLTLQSFGLEPEQECSISKFSTKFPQAWGRKDFEQLIQKNNTLK